MADLTQARQMLEQARDLLDRLDAELTRLDVSATEGDRGPAPTTTPAPAESNVIAPKGVIEAGTDSIVGGTKTKRGDFPDCCAVGNDAQFFCTGTLIAPNVVVTAKHCPAALPITRVFLKGNDITRPASGEEVRVAEVFLHPDKKVDLAVLLLETNATVPPRHVAQGTEMDGAKVAQLVGFGTVDLGGTVGYGIKRQVKVGIVSLDCSDPADVAKYGCRSDYEVVAGHRGLKKDSCRGDSGGPLYIAAPEDVGGYYLLGATSRGSLDAKAVCGDGGVYVRVDKFLDWIKEVTGAQIEGPKA
jgi:secreted trypsin-like serine protease